jgi:hypothetical protein
MIKVYQDMTVGTHGVGNCFAACLASLLELPLKDMPSILPTDKGSHNYWEMWLKDRGYELDTFSPHSPPKGYSIATVTTKRTYPEGHSKAGGPIYHACVFWGSSLVHDPFPLGSDITDVCYYRELIVLPEAERTLHEIMKVDGYCRHGYRKDCSACDYTG